MIKNEYFVLNNGVRIPAIGFGTWQVAYGEEAYNSCLWALKAGYGHIDTAFAYGNEQSEISYLWKDRWSSNTW
jgi:diketogulonate reductase-like aldo/keto reductase